MKILHKRNILNDNSIFIRLGHTNDEINLVQMKKQSDRGLINLKIMSKPRNIYLFAKTTYVDKSNLDDAGKFRFHCSEGDQPYNFVFPTVSAHCPEGPNF